VAPDAGLAASGTAALPLHPWLQPVGGEEQRPRPFSAAWSSVGWSAGGRGFPQGALGISGPATLGAQGQRRADILEPPGCTPASRATTPPHAASASPSPTRVFCGVAAGPDCRRALNHDALSQGRAFGARHYDGHVDDYMLLLPAEMVRWTKSFCFAPAGRPLTAEEICCIETMTAAARDIAGARPKTAEDSCSPW
jgi:hypothetical protein